MIVYSKQYARKFCFPKLFDSYGFSKCCEFNYLIPFEYFPRYPTFSSSFGDTFISTTGEFFDVFESVFSQKDYFS